MTWVANKMYINRKSNKNSKMLNLIMSFLKFKLVSKKFKLKDDNCDFPHRLEMGMYVYV